MYIMNKINWIVGFLILLVTVALIKPLQESFVTHSIGRGYGIGGVGYDLDYTPQVDIPNGKLFGNMRYPGKAYLSIAEPNGYLYNNQSDDSIPFLSFPFLK